jgi:hypothetical protein
MKLLLITPGVIVGAIVTWQIVTGHQEGAFWKQEGQKRRLECAKRQEVDLVSPQLVLLQSIMTSFISGRPRMILLLPCFETNAASVRTLLCSNLEGSTFVHRGWFCCCWPLWLLSSVDCSSNCSTSGSRLREVETKHHQEEN